MTRNAFQGSAEPTGRMTAWVTSGSQNPVLGILQAGTYVVRAHVHVTESFNSDGTDTLTVGWDSDADAIITSVDVSTTGVKTITLGANNGYNDTARNIEAYYVNSGTEPTQGKAFVVIELFRVPLQP